MIWAGERWRGTKKGSGKMAGYREGGTEAVFSLADRLLWALTNELLV